MSQKPRVFIKNIIFNDNTQLELNHDSIVVFTGPNNCGKSQVLKDIENSLSPMNNSLIVAIRAELEFLGDIDDPDFISDNFYENSQGRFVLYSASTAFSIDNMHEFWSMKTLHSNLHKAFVNRLCTESRIIDSNSLNRNERQRTSPILRIYNNDYLARKVSDYFKQAFGKDLIINRYELQTVSLYVGQAPDGNSYLMSQFDEYYKRVSALDRLQEQGDGMRSFASILLDTFTSDYSITLIDEPEAFLHPPQARVLGKMLAKNNPNERQLFISTHSEDFLQGLLDADCDNITVVRINRENAINKMSILQNNEIKKLWSTPLLRYSNILSGLFHEKVIVCESDYDCLFYQAIINAMFESNGEIAPDYLFTHCGGKTRIKDVVSALKAVNVPVVAICDFDIVHLSSDFKPLVEAFGTNYKTELQSSMKTIYDSINKINSGKANAWDVLKKTGKHGLTDEAPAAYDKVESICKSIGLFIVPVGEMEGFDKTIYKEKKEWVYQVLEQYDLAVEPKLEAARKFVGEILDF